MKTIIFSTFLVEISGQYFGDYKVRLEKWNSGRVYFAEWNGFFLGNYGPVCAGTRDEAITGQNAQFFAKAICNEVGFGINDAVFIGRSQFCTTNLGIC